MSEGLEGIAYLQVVDLPRLRAQLLLLLAGFLKSRIELAADFIILAGEIFDLDSPLRDFGLQCVVLVANEYISDSQPSSHLILDNEVGLMVGAAVLHVQIVQNFDSLSIDSSAWLLQRVGTSVSVAISSTVPCPSPCLRYALH